MIYNSIKEKSMSSIQPISGFRAQQTSFGGRHLPRNFSSMMNYIYKKTNKNYSGIVNSHDMMHVSTVLDNGKEISGVVIFQDGHYSSLIMDEGFEGLRQVFMRTALERYNNKVMPRRLQEKVQRQKRDKKALR